MYVCLCNAITERQVRECVESGAQSLDELMATLGVGAGCGRCCESAAEVLREVHGEGRARPSSHGEAALVPAPPSLAA